MSKAGGLPGNVRTLLASVAAAPRSLLLLDFDGTLAPFRTDPSRVKPWLGVTALLDAIQAAGRTRLVLISGRPARDVIAQLGLKTPPEAWGLHGAEHLLPNGQIQNEQLPAQKQAALHAAREALRQSGLMEQFGIRTEAKWNAVVAHWRGLPAESIPSVRAATLAMLHPFHAAADLELLLFDGGLELRAGRNKGDAVRQLLAETPAGTPAAYLGDDLTDEHAFAAIADRGMGILVRREQRPTAAQAWIQPPQGLRHFLRGWLRAVSRRDAFRKRVTPSL